MIWVSSDDEKTVDSPQWACASPQSHTLPSPLPSQYRTPLLPSPTVEVDTSFVGPASIHSCPPSAGSSARFSLDHRIPTQLLSRPSSPSSDGSITSSTSSPPSSSIPLSLYPVVGPVPRIDMAPLLRSVPYKRMSRMPRIADAVVHSLTDPVTTRTRQRRLIETLRRSQRQTLFDVLRRRPKLTWSHVVLCACAVVYVMYLLSSVTVKRSYRRSPIPLSSDLFQSWSWSTSDLVKRDTLVMYRIIGNDLPPRHSPSQTLTNLRFLLEHEHAFGDLAILRSRALRGPDNPPLKVEKYWVFNRLANATQLAAVHSLLESFNVPADRILEIPFEWDAYTQKNWKWDGGVGWGDGMESIWGIGRHSEHGEVLAGNASDAVFQIQPESWSRSEAERSSAWNKKKEAMARLRALDFTYHEKNLYAMNNNGGRNFALDHGRSLPHARWILPLDGNCFFSPSAIVSLAESLNRNNNRRHVIIPMARMLSNRDALVNNTVIPQTLQQARTHSPLAPEEPQVGFRWDSTERYSEQMRYGRRSKVELLWRLGAIDVSRDLSKKTHPWEVTERELLAPETHSSIVFNASEAIRKTPDFFEAGWVLRLSSGHPLQEQHSIAASARRSINRIRGIVSFLEVLDEGVARGIDVCDDLDCGFASHRLWTWDSADLMELQRKWHAGDEVVRRKLVKFEKRAQNLVDSVQPKLDKGGWSSRGDDAESIAATAASLALAGTLLGDDKYSRIAAQLIYARFLRPIDNEPKFTVKSRSLDVGQGDGVAYAFPIPRHSLTPVWLKNVRTRLPFDPLSFDPTLLLDAVRLLSQDWRPNYHNQIFQDDTFPELPNDELEDIFTTQLSYLLLHPKGQQACSHPETIVNGARYDLKVAALAAFVNDAQLLGRIANRSRLRVSNSLLTRGPTEQPRFTMEEKEALKLRRKLLSGLIHVKMRPFDNVHMIQQWLGAVVDEGDDDDGHHHLLQLQEHAQLSRDQAGQSLPVRFESESLIVDDVSMFETLFQDI